MSTIRCPSCQRAIALPEARRTALGASAPLVLALALVLVLAIAQWMGLGIVQRNQKPPPPPKPETVPVLVAAFDIPPLTEIAPEMVKVYECPKDLVPTDALTKVEDALGRGVMTPLVKGEFLLNAKLAPRGTGRGLGAKIPKGMP